VNHVDGTEDAHNHAHDGGGQAHGVQQHDGEHDAAGGNARCTNGNQCGQEDKHGLLSEREVNAVNLGNKDDGDGVVNCNAVHVDGGTQRQGEGGQLALDAEILFRDFEADRQGSGTARGAECYKPYADNLAEKFRKRNFGNDFTFDV